MFNNRTRIDDHVPSYTGACIQNCGGHNHGALTNGCCFIYNGGRMDGGKKSAGMRGREFLSDGIAANGDDHLVGLPNGRLCLGKTTDAPDEIMLGATVNKPVNMDILF
jgi:hypothetical protein